MVTTVLCAFLALTLGYFLGSVPFGLILTRVAGEADIRSIGSGSIGATNVLRTGKKGLALATLLLDAAKGAAAVWLTHSLTQAIPHTPEAFSDLSLWLLALAGVGAVLGHVFPVWLKFKGGKGAATALGVFLALSPLMGLCAAGAWLVVALVTRLSSLSSLVMMATAMAYAAVFNDSTAKAFAVLLIVTLVIVRHRDNIGRLLRGQEPRIALHRSEDSSAPCQPPKH